jgi:hypothetical protein
MRRKSDRNWTLDQTRANSVTGHKVGFYFRGGDAFQDDNAEILIGLQLRFESGVIYAAYSTTSIDEVVLLYKRCYTFR